MRKIIIILLCLPVFLLSQEENKYERTISFSQFAQELKEAAEKGADYTLQNCYISMPSSRPQQIEETETRTRRGRRSQAHTQWRRR